MYADLNINDTFNYFLEVIITFFLITLKDDCDFNLKKTIKKIIIIIIKKEINKYLFIIISIEFHKFIINNDNKYLSLFLNNTS